MKRQRNITRKSQTSLRVQENPIKYLINGLETTYLSLFAILCEICEFMSLMIFTKTQIAWKILLREILHSTGSELLIPNILQK